MKEKQQNGTAVEWWLLLVVKGRYHLGGGLVTWSGVNVKDFDCHDQCVLKHKNENQKLNLKHASCSLQGLP